MGEPELERLRELSRAATPGPWIRRWASLDVHHMSGDDALQAQADIDFAVAACAYVRDRLAAPSAELVGVTCDYPIGKFGTPCERWTGHDGGHFALSRPVATHKHRWNAAGVCRCGRARSGSETREP